MLLHTVHSYSVITDASNGSLPCPLLQTHTHVLHYGNYGMFFLSLPVFRLVFVVRTFRDLMFGLLNAIPDFGSLFVVLGVRAVVQRHASMAAPVRIAVSHP